jgi:hypothetical protein
VEYPEHWREGENDPNGALSGGEIDVIDLDRRDLLERLIREEDVTTE